MLPRLRRAKFSKGVLYSIIWVRFEGSKYTKRRSGLAGQESHNLSDRQQNSAPGMKCLTTETLQIVQSFSSRRMSMLLLLGIMDERCFKQRQRVVI
jgi:hypothetical protein